MRIVFDAGMDGPDRVWGPWDCETGLGGSEESVVWLSEALARRGHRVTVVNNCGRDNSGWDFGGVRYYMPGRMPEIDRPDLYVSWRDSERAASGWSVSRKSWLWCHDIPVPPHWPQQGDARRWVLQNVDKVVLLNEHHERLYTAAGLPDYKAFVIPIGIVREQFDVPDPPERIPGRVIACYHPSRGLDLLRAAWPEVRRRVPHATLAAFWWQPECFLPADEANGILPMRSLGHAELARELMKAEVFGYACNGFPEVSPASCIKSQCAGAIPVYVPSGGMLDVLDFGVRCDHSNFASTLAATLENSAALDSFRAQMMESARLRWDWNKVAEAWEREAMA